MHVQQNGVQLMKAMAMADIGDGEGGALRLEDVANQFKQWRQSRVRGERIPVALWGEAVLLCQEHAPQRVAGVMRVALASLMQRLERTSDVAAQRPGRYTEFVEVIMTTATAATPEPVASRLERSPKPERPTNAATPTPAFECVLELENAHGAKMRVQLNGAGLVSLGQLLSSFWGAT
jgi:hypothetical protein